MITPIETSASGEDDQDRSRPESATRSTALPSLSIARSLAILAVSVGLQVVCTVIVLATPWDQEQEASLVSYVVVMGSSVWLACRIRRIRMAPSSLDLRIPPRATFVPLATGSLALLFGPVHSIIMAIPMSEEIRQLMTDMNTQTGFWMFFMFVIGAPVLEELLFRGVILDGLLRRYSPVTAILVSSLLFGAAHLNPWQFVTGTVIGAFAGWVYYRSRSLIACIVIHMATNAAGYVVRLFLDVETQMAPDASLVDTYGGLLLLVGWMALFVVAFLLSVRSLRRSFDGVGIRRAQDPG